MRVFAKDVSGQKLDRGFESRPLRLVTHWFRDFPTHSGGRYDLGSTNERGPVAIVFFTRSEGEGGWLKG